MNQRERDALDRHITGNYGEDQFKEETFEEYTPPQKRTVAQLAQEAIDIQDACNLLGLSKAYAQALQDLWDTGLNGLPELENHPVNKLWLSKLCDLSKIIVDDWTEYQSFKDCQDLAKGG